MKKTAIVYGSTTGTTESVARMIAGKMGVLDADVYDVGRLKAGQLDNYDFLVLGTSTWGCGELQDDWYDGLKFFKSMPMEGKVVALFGCGDCESYSDTFCDAMGLIYQELKQSGCHFIGAVPVADYQYVSSQAVVDGRFVGLAIDEMNESEKTDTRIDAWIACIKEAGL